MGASPAAQAASFCDALGDDVQIRPLNEGDLDCIVDLSLRAWEPIFGSLRHVLGDAIFARLHQPDWRTVQAQAVRESCTSDERDVFVAAVGNRPVGFSAWR